MKNILRLMLMIFTIMSAIVGIVLGCHATFYQMLYGGLCDIVTGATSVPIEALLITKGAVKFLFCGIPGIIVSTAGCILSLGSLAAWCVLDD